jgi:hypothetical protein
MPQLTATLTLDLSTCQTRWQAAKQATAALPAKIQAVQATLGGITVQGAPGPAGTMTFTATVTDTATAAADLHAAVQALLAAVEQFQADLASLPVVVSQVT